MFTNIVRELECWPQTLSLTILTVLIPGSGQFCSPDISGIKEDIAIIQSTLEQKLTEGRNISTELDRAKKEKKSLQAENMRLNHR